MQNRCLSGLLRRSGRAMVVGACGTAVAMVGLYLAARAGGATEANCVLTALAAVVLWIAIAAPMISASADDWASRLLRAGALADAAGLCLLVIWLLGRAGREPVLQFVAAVKVYCILGVMTLAAAAAVSVARGIVARYAAALASAIVLLVACSTPFWINGLVDYASPAWRTRIVELAVESNPFYAVTTILVERTHQVWHQSPVIYDITRIGEYNAPGPAEWYWFVLGCGAAGAAFFAVAMVRARWRSSK